MACDRIFSDVNRHDIISASKERQNISDTGDNLFGIFDKFGAGSGGGVKMILQVENLSVAYGAREVVHDINFSVAQGQIFVIVGESGGGKSTILKSIAGILGAGRITGGRIIFDGREITNLSGEERRKISGAGIGYIFQNATASFCPVRTIGEQIYESVRAHWNWSRAEFRLRAENILQNINLEKGVLDEYPFRLSGGMGQRAGILAAMILQPKLLLADEPTSALDVETQRGVIAEFLNLRERYGVTIVMVTHNLKVADTIADKIFKLQV